LKYNDGKEVTGQYGDQVLYTLTDGRVMYVPHIVKKKIDALGIGRGELFTITKAAKNSTPRGRRSNSGARDCGMRIMATQILGNYVARSQNCAVLVSFRLDAADVFGSRTHGLSSAREHLLKRYTRWP